MADESPSDTDGSEPPVVRRRSGSRSPSLIDVSREAGVSVASASRVLNGSPHPVSAALRARVLAAAERVRYVPSVFAQGLARNQSRIVGVIVQDSTDPYFAEIVRGIEEHATRAGYLTIACNAERRSEVEVAQFQLLRDYKAVGIVFGASGLVQGERDDLRALVEEAQSEGVAVVSVGRRDFTASRIGFDNEQASYDLTRDLAQRGSRRIAFIGGLPDAYASQERLHGYTRAMEGAGLESQIVRGTFASESGTSAAVRLLADGPLPDAIVAANDQTAVGVMTSLRSSGIDVPGDVLVAGIGATSLARLLDLTSVGVHLRMLGGMVASRVLEHRPKDHVTTLLPHSIEQRSSTARGMS